MAPVLAKSLNRLSRDTLIDLALDWLQHDRCATPYLTSNRRLFEADEEDYLHTPAESIEALRRTYKSLQKDSRLGTKRDVIDRIVDGDWRRGLSLHQHAMIDFAYLEQNEAALRWSALRLVPLDSAEEMSDDSDSQPPKKKCWISRNEHTPRYPQISAQSFLSALKKEISPMVKAHYHLHRMSSYQNLDIVRVYITPSSTFRARRTTIPRNVRHAVEAGRVMYIAFPGSCPYVYISLCGASVSSGRAKGARDSKGRVMAKVDMAAMKKIVLEAIPKAFSRPQERWALESTKLNARSLKSICELRGNQKPGSAGGAYSSFSEPSRDIDGNSIDLQQEPDQRASLLEVEKRFGTMTGQHHAALDRVHIKLEKDIQRDKDNSPDVLGEEAATISLTFTGNDVFQGLKKLAELGSEYVDLSRMPAMLTGELGVSSIVI
ncbi:centromere protein Chl4/mis15/CENP-N [Exophiala viscosa]|uniref:centromere protein Chl4/mis15/CENP-N n=1 Tax=Exophiala viscosa TaxID=2486360 RepID=UPI00219250E0|nr:centromere protein Chl4/mis15/CENP-N [Exophiala viscosa]